MGGLTAVLLLAGCGQSAGGKSTQTSTAKSTQQTTGTPTQHAATGVSTVPPPSVSSNTGAAGVVIGSAGEVTATLHAGTHHPKVDTPWPIRFTVSSGGRAARASLSYEYLFGGQVVAHRSHYIFTGHFSDIFKWPSSAVGYTLTFRAVIASGTKTINLDYPVQVTE